jgi:hypothetical protein
MSDGYTPSVRIANVNKKKKEKIYKVGREEKKSDPGRGKWRTRRVVYAHSCGYIRLHIIHIGY